MRKLLIIALLVMGYSCYITSIETKEEYQKRTAEEEALKLKRTADKAERRAKAKKERLKKIPRDAFTIEFANLSQEEINNKSYLWLKTKFPNYDEIRETKGKGIIRIVGRNLLATPEIMGYKVIIIIDTEAKSVKFWFGRQPVTRQDKPVVGGVTFQGDEEEKAMDTERDIKEEQAMDMVQSYKDFLLSR